MADLTKEYFEQKIEKLVSKEDLTQNLAPLATKKNLDEGLEGLAEIVNTAFDKQNEYLETKFAEVAAMTKLRERLDDHERKFRQLERTLNVKF